MSSYRQRVYADYVGDRLGVPVPDTIDGLAPLAPHLSRLVERHFPPDRTARILDLGCGHGALLHFAHRAGYANAAGIDNSPAQVAAAQRLGIDGVHQGDLMATLGDIAADSLDVVIAYDVIEHLTKDELFPVADGVHRILKPGGRWIIHVPNGASPFCGAVLYADLTHEFAFTAESLAQLVLQSGFRDLACFEDEPVPHGLKSAVRWVLWKAIRAGWHLYNAVETGVAARPILSRNLLAVAVK